MELQVIMMITLGQVGNEGDFPGASDILLDLEATYNGVFPS